MPTWTNTTRIWTSTNGLWDSTSSWSGQTIPIVGDRVIFSTQYSNHPVLAGPTTPVDLNKITVEDGWVSNICSRGTPLQYVTADEFIYRGHGSCFYKVRHPSVNATDRLVINSPNRIDAFFLDTHTSGNSVNNVCISRGSLDVAATAVTIGNLNIRVINGQTDTIVRAHYNATLGFSYVSMSGGIFICDKPITIHAVQSGGKWTHTHNMAGLWLTGGMHWHNANDPRDYEYVNLHGGTIDLTQSGGTKTIAAIEKHQNGTVIYNGSHDVTYTNMTGYEER